MDEITFSFFLCDIVHLPFDSNFTKVGVSRYIGTNGYVGFEEIDDGIWNVYFGPLKLGRFDERHMRIEDQYGKLKRRDL